MNYLNIKRIAVPIFLFITITNYSQEEEKVFNSDSTKTSTDLNYEFLMAAYDGDSAKVIKLIEKGADVNYKTPDEEVTALMYAAQNGHLETVRILLHQGADVNAWPVNHVDALLGACMLGHVYIADTLILNGADVSTKNLEGVTPLMVAASSNDSIMADMLIFYRADLNIQDAAGNTALHYATYYGSTGVSELLLAKQANVNIADNNGFTPLMIAAQKGFSYLADLYLKSGAVVDTSNDNDLTALSLAIINGYKETAELLIKSGADVNHYISETRNQFSLAQEFADKDMQQLLEFNGASKLPSPFIDRVMVNADINWNLDDFMVGGNLSCASTKFGIEFQAGYKTRTGERSILYEITPTTYYQFWESRSVMHIGANKLFSIFSNTIQRKSGVFGGLNLAYSYGNFRGSEKKPEDVLLLVPKAGVFWSSQSFNVKLNYEYMNLRNPNVSRNRINISLGFNINTGKGKIALKEEPVW